ncbi:hypothetical protein [Pseudomonas sp. 273]|uniref:hypothetical protein n=1 Tax=Pseudomonas sp. 273 TaxID=75692 RepID=UPI0023D7EB9F|nr:hypothetical protein [Pseudomonas sp. 273]
MTTVTLEHLRSIPGYGKKPGFCAGKAREFFLRHGLDWYAFRHGGLPAELFLATGDALALALVKWAQQCEAANGQ